MRPNWALRCFLALGVLVAALAVCDGCCCQLRAAHCEQSQTIVVPPGPAKPRRISWLKGVPKKPTRPVWVHYTGGNRCEWCLKMDRETLDDPRVVLESDRYHCVKIETQERNRILPAGKITGTHRHFTYGGYLEAETLVVLLRSASPPLQPVPRGADEQ